MRRRNSTLSHGLDRRKSNASVKSVQLEHILPTTAEQDAQVAAARAFAWARERSRLAERSALDNPQWPPPRYVESYKNGSQTDSPSRKSNDTSIHRRQSVRFERPRTSQTSNDTRASTSSPMATHNPGATVKLNITGRGVEQRSANSASAAGMVSAAKGVAGDYINALITGEEYYNPEDDIVFAPSSFRRIRKSRSMFTTSEGSNSSHLYNGTQPPIVPHHTAESSTTLRTDENQPPPGLKAPKSMSFLRGRRGHSSLHSERCGDTSISFQGNVCGDSLNNKGAPLKTRPSTIFRSKTTCSDRAFRKTMRDSSNSTNNSNGKLPKDGSLRDKARKVSQTFKYKLKNLFNLSKSDSDESIFPAQHVDSHKSHGATSIALEDNANDEFGYILADEGALSQVTSGVPSLHAVPSYQQLKSRKGSVESLKSERQSSDEKSRVTSWAESETNTLNTLGSRRGEWEPQRLSVIKENGTHTASSSARRPMIDGYFDPPSSNGLSLPPVILPPPPTVDSQRIYSALMKRLDETTKKTHEDSIQRKKSFDDFAKSGTVPVRTSSKSSRARGSDSPITIRQVPPDTGSETGSIRTIHRRPVAQGGYRPQTGEYEQVFPEAAFTSSVSAPTVNRSQGQPAGGGLLSVPRIEEREIPARALSSRSSAFFGSPTSHLFRTQSPYRRALRETINTAEKEALLKSPEFNPWIRSLSSLPIRRPSICESEMDQKMNYTESIYSANTDDPVNISNNTSSMVEDFPRPPSAHGDATIFLDPPAYQPRTPIPPRHRISSSSSSTEWKTWLSAKVSKLEESSIQPDTCGLGDTLSAPRLSGHVRENAQINDEDEDNEQQESFQSSKSSSPFVLSVHDTPVNSDDQQPSQQKTLTPSTSASVEDKPVDVSMPSCSPSPPFPPPLPPKSSMRLQPPVGGIDPPPGPMSNAGDDSTEGKEKASQAMLSFAHSQSLQATTGNQVRATGKTTRKLVRRCPILKNHNSLGLAPAVEAQFRKVTGAPGPSSSNDINVNENISPHTISIVDNEGRYGTRDSSLQAQNNKKMVDMILGDRRRRLAATASEDTDDGHVFL
ncbi:hypothetical protein F4778DRAFT_407697 [Xylariomycetidae sp. FL2044]|nr:hypothetical protein F4778DRAFT_407697 [Xylariomycetidae sp. FL2044]